MGDTGPCGPCSEIHYDMGPAASDQGHTDCKFGCECGRYVEIWNLVFMQFNRDASGTVAPLPKPSIDTGAGLERLAAVLQGKISNFDTDLFVPLIERAGELTGTRPGASSRSDASLRIIADHARASTFLISDGVVPSNEGRGYVLRKIMRRGIRHGRLLGTAEPFLAEMSRAVHAAMRDAYPELDESIERVSKIILSEEKRFAHTLDIGLVKLMDDIRPLMIDGSLSAPSEQIKQDVEHEMGECKGLAGAIARPVYQGEKAFKLYDTYGLPRDFIEDVTRDAGLHVDWPGFERAMVEQRTRARASWKGGHKDVANPVYTKLAETYRTEPDFYFGTTAQAIAASKPSSRKTAR